MANRILRDLIGLQSAELGAGEINTMNRVKSSQGWGCRFILAACAMSEAITLTGCFAISFAGALLAIAFSANRAIAQVTSDGTLGTQVGTNGNNFDITGGTTVGNTNLFHSFGSFSVPDGGSANFQNADTITNIFGRVTGGSTSNIQGTIRVLGKANLFLMNPSGIIFGPNARLDLQGGSFVGTTANAIRFPGGGEFSLTSSVDPNNSVLAVNPSALFFNQTPAGAIVNQSRATDPNDPSTLDGLKVPDGRSLLLVGGEVRLDGGIIKAPGGRVELGGLAASGEVEIFGRNNFLGLRFPEGIARADVSLTNQAGITASISSGGSEDAGIVILRGNNVSVDNSRIFSQILAGGQGNAGGILIEAGSLSLANNAGIASSSFGSGNAGDIVIDVDGSVSLNNSTIQSNVENQATNSIGGLIDIKAGSLSLLNGSQVQTLVRGNENGQQPGQGKAGDVLVEVRDTLTISGKNSQGFSSAIFSDLGSGATGNAGRVGISAGSVQVTDGARVSTSTLGNGDAGIVLIEAKGDVSLTGNGTLITSNVEQGATGNTVGVRIDARSLFMSGGAEVQVLTRGNGSAGAIVINASDVADFRGVSPEGPSTGLFSSTEGNGTGDGGLIEVNAGTLRLSDAAVLSARTQTAGAGGGILVNVNTLELLDGGQILATAYSSGASGAIIINAKDKIVLSGRDPTFVDRALQLYETYVAQYGEGQALKLFLQTFDNIPPGSSGIFANVILDSTAEAGGILITTKDLFIRDGATISVDNPGPQAAGDIVIIGRDLIMKNQGTINARATSGKGGNIILGLQDFLLLLQNSRISTTSGFDGQGGDGGNIRIVNRYTIGAPFNNNDIRANAFTGTGGNIRYRADRLYDIQERDPSTIRTNDITASSEFGVDGIVTSTILNVDPTQGLTNLPTNPIDPSTLIAETCAPRGGIADKPNNQFTVTGRNGLPPDPNAAFTGEAVVNELEPANQTEENSTDSPNSTNPESSAPAVTASPQEPEIVEAQGWVYGKNGDVIFTAQAPTVTPNHPTLTPASTCNGF